MQCSYMLIKQLAPNVALRKLIVGWQEGEAKSGRSSPR